MSKYTGSCLCGFITYSFSSEIQPYGYCHCSMCRKSSGSTYSANAGVAEKFFKLEDPHNYLKEYKSSLGTHRFFCSNCGSPLFSRVEQQHGFVRIRLGTLDTFFDKKAERHTFVSDKAPWHDIEGDIPQYDKKFQN